MVYALTGKGEGGFTNMYLDLETMEWQRLTPPPVPVFECAVVALDEKIYVIGGKDLDGNVLNRVWVYDSQAEE
jgi:N-acetylneuraminic acid mutarotase